MIVFDERQRRIELGEGIGHGGEAVVYRFASQPDHLAKIYKPAPRPNYAGKLDWMVSHPPENPTQQLGHASLAWPGGLLFDSRRKLTGYWMPYIRDTVPMLEVFNPRRRAEVLPQFDRRYLLRTARNLAAALSALHRSGYVAGDLNESNVLVTHTALVTLIDTDSFQVSEERNGNHIVHPCPVGKPEYTPPELQRLSLAEVVRQPDHDSFGLAVLIFQLLMEGSHPFRAQWLAAGDPPPLEVRIANGAYPYVEEPAYPVLPPKNAVGIETLHPWLRELFRRCFVEGHRDPRWRPGPELWVRALTEAEQAQVLCSEGHYYSSHLRNCPYCEIRLQRAAAAAEKQPVGAAARAGAKPGAAAPAGQRAAGQQRAANPNPPNRGWSAPPFAQPRPAAGATPSAAPARQPAPAQAGAGAAVFRTGSMFSRGFAWPRTSPVGVGGSSGGMYGSSGPGMRGVLRSRPVMTPQMMGQWVGQQALKTFTVGGAQGALVGAIPGALIGLINWSSGELLLWNLIFAIGGALGGLLRGWKPGHKLASLIDRFLGWKLFFQGLGLLSGAVLGGLLSLPFIWAIFPVIIGMILGAQTGMFVGRKLWQVGNLLGWERIWGLVSALGFGVLGFGVAQLAGALGAHAFGASLSDGLMPFAANGSYTWAFIWTMAGALGGAVAGALGGMLTDFLGRISRLVN